MGKMMLAVLLLLAVGGFSYPVEHGLGEDSAVNLDSEQSSAAALKDKLKKLDHTMARIKRSCVANNVPSELGEGKDVKAEKPPTTIAELKAAIKAKEKAIDKVTDACMPGETNAEATEMYTTSDA